MLWADAIGLRGESLCFGRLLDKFERDRPYFQVAALREKYPVIDFFVELIGVDRPSPFLIQVKATDQSIQGKRLPVKIIAEEVRKLASNPLPTYIVGMDNQAETGYLLGIASRMRDPIMSLPTHYPLTQDNMRLLWREVRDFWKSARKWSKTSRFKD